MNWFGRYGIPGSYFIGLTVGWIYVFYRALFERFSEVDTTLLVGLAGIVFLPIGYMISTFSQWVYLNWRTWFADIPWLRRCLGFHGAAFDRVRDPKKPLSRCERDEAIIEARTIFLTASANGKLTVDSHNYIRDRIARRMDVVAMNSSIILATIFAPFLLFIISLFGFQYFLPRNGPAIYWWLAVSFLIIVVAVMIWSIMTLRKQVIEIIALIYMNILPDRDSNSTRRQVETL